MTERQLPVYSPVSLTAALSAAREVIAVGEDPRANLSALLRRDYRATEVVLCGSGTQALTLAIDEASEKVGAPSSVALPAFSCFDVASAAIGTNLPMSFYDLDPDTLSPDLESLERLLRAGVKIVVVAPLYGIPVEWDAINRIVREYDAIVVEDAAQAHGATWRKKPVGSFAPLSTLSFGRGKGWTGGRGGAFLVREGGSETKSDLAAYNRTRAAAVAFAILAQWVFARPSIYGIPAAIPSLGLGETLYIPPQQPEAMTRSAAVSLMRTHDAAALEAEKRRSNARRLLSSMREKSLVRTIKEPKRGTAGYLRLPLRLRYGMATFESPPTALRMGIAASYPRLLPHLAAVSTRLTGPERHWPGAQTLVSQLITVPTHSRLTDLELADIEILLAEISRPVNVLRDNP